MNLNEIRIDGTVIPVHEKDLNVEDVEFGYSEETFIYEFLSPWIGLNQNNFKAYLKTEDPDEKNLLLNKTMTGNILATAKGLGCWLEKDQQIRLDVQLKEKPATLKGKTMVGFMGIFKSNFLIPDYLWFENRFRRDLGL